MGILSGVRLVRVGRYFLQIHAWETVNLWHCVYDSLCHRKCIVGYGV